MSVSPPTISKSISFAVRRALRTDVQDLVPVPEQVIDRLVDPHVELERSVAGGAQHDPVVGVDAEGFFDVLDVFHGVALTAP